MGKRLSSQSSGTGPRRKRKICIHREQVLCVAVSLILFGAAQSMNQTDTIENGAVKRGSPGSGEILYELMVNGLTEDEALVEIAVSSRMAGEEEARQNRRLIMEQLPEMILQDNHSLQEIRSDLNLIGSIEDQGIRLEWEPGDPERIDVFGQVSNQDIGEEGVDTYLDVIISDEVGKSVFRMPVRVLPPALTEDESHIRDFLEAVSQRDGETRQEGWLVLPTQLHGKALSYRLNRDKSPWLILLLGIVGAVLYGLREPAQKREKEKKRKELLLLEYSEVVSKLQIYLGAGMTVRTAWERMAKDYEKAAAGEKGRKPVYEEILQTCADFRRGISESEAYRRFGRRCGLRPYLKLSSLLEQNRKTGLKNLRQMLDAEVADAFEERKNLARRQGEEAGTKLLMPMFMMLGIVMVIIVVPAFMSFY